MNSWFLFAIILVVWIYSESSTWISRGKLKSPLKGGGMGQGTKMGIGICVIVAVAVLTYIAYDYSQRSGSGSGTGTSLENDSSLETDTGNGSGSGGSGNGGSGNGGSSPIDCVGSWGEYGDCSETCGDGTQTKTYTVTTAASNGGTCEAANGATSQKACHLDPCPINCVGSWGEYGGCSLECDSGTQTKTYTVTTPSSYGGTACTEDGADGAEVVDGAEEYQTCNPEPCTTDCDGSWVDDDGVCSKCDGTKTQTYVVRVAPSNGGTACGAANGDNRTQTCPVVTNDRWCKCSNNTDSTKNVDCNPVDSRPTFPKSDGTLQGTEPQSNCCEYIASYGEVSSPGDSGMVPRYPPPAPAAPAGPAAPDIIGSVNQAAADVGMPPPMLSNPMDMAAALEPPAVISIHLPAAVSGTCSVTPNTLTNIWGDANCRAWLAPGHSQVNTCPGTNYGVKCAKECQEKICNSREESDCQSDSACKWT